VHDVITAETRVADVIDAHDVSIYRQAKAIGISLHASGVRPVLKRLRAIVFPRCPAE